MINFIGKKAVKASLLCMIMFSLFSCSGPEVELTHDVIYNRPIPKQEFDYELGPGDVMEIVYHYTPKPATLGYYLAVGDILRVEFAFHPGVNRDLTVTPDGNIAMPTKGEVKVLGLTTAQVQKKLVELYSQDFIDPVVTVTMVEYNRAIEHLKKAIKTAPRGQSKLTTVRADGYVTFPVIRDVYARGKTVPELKEIIQREYEKQVDNLTITLILKVVRSNLVYIMGEVNSPGYYLMEHPYTVAQIAARAGGLLPTAESDSILVITRDEDRKPWGRIINLRKVLKMGDLSQDISLRQYDVVYVPKTKIAKANLFVEQYINNMIPTNLVSAYEIGGTMINNRPILNDGLGGSTQAPTAGDDD